MAADEWYTLNNGTRVVTHVLYDHRESRGPLALAVAAGLSLCAVTAMLIAIALTGFKTRHQFIRSQVGAYFLSLLFSDLLQATGSIMNARWVVIQGVSTGSFCVAQAALKQTGNVGTALWSLVIAIHTFCLLFLRLRVGNLLFYTILIGVWMLLGFVVMMGPVIIQKSNLGPFWGISGYWCWITDAYHVEQFTDEYLFMFITAVVSFILYSFIFFRLRGNLQGFGWDLRFRRVPEPWVASETDESQMSTVGRQMLWYPVAYVIIVLPIAACRWSAIFGHKVPYWATIAADSIFMLSGFVNAILYSTTRKIVSVRALLPFAHLIRIGSARNTDMSHKAKASLEDMQFTIPSSPHATAKSKSIWRADGSQMAPVTAPVRLWKVQPGVSPQHVQTNLAETESPVGLYRLEAPSEVSGGGFTSEAHVLEYPSPTPSHNNPSHTSINCAGIPSIPYQDADARSSRPRTGLDLPRTDVDGAGTNENRSRAPSDSSLTTDGAPSSHHKRFSGWSFPSIRERERERGAAPYVDGDSIRMELEEMRFASPSPEWAMRKPASRPASTGDLPPTRWPPRCGPLE